MSHFTTERDPSQPTPREWLKVGAQIGDLVNEWSGRNDVVAFVGPGAGGNAPACFKPLVAEMEINVTIAFGERIKPEHIDDLSVRRNQFEWPAAMGATYHESMHAKHSRWSFEDLYAHPKPLVSAIAILFEESRIEARGVALHPTNRSFLRACALDIVLRDTKADELEKSGLQGLSQLILLTLARVDAGVLEPEDVEVFREKTVDLLGEELLDELRRIWVAGQAHLFDWDCQPLLRLAERWLEVMKDAGHDMEAEQENNEALAKMLGEMMGALGEMAEDAETAAGIEGMVQVQKEAVEEELRERAEAAAEKGHHEETSEKVFGGKESFGGMYGGTNSTLQSDRKPTTAERAAANKVGGLLEKAKYHDRIVVDHRSAVPPGRLRMQEIMRGQVERSRGAVSTIEPFNSRTRHHALDPNLKVGVLVDISGSMDAAMLPMAVTAWMLSEAARRISARCAMVYYGNSVFPVLRPGQHLDNVRIYDAPDSTEEFEPAFKAINGSLNLLHGEGARLLVICSDMSYRRDMIPKAEKWVRRCSEAGVAVLILPFDGGHYASPYIGIPGVQIIPGSLNPVTAASRIGLAAVKALEGASR